MSDALGLRGSAVATEGHVPERCRGVDLRPSSTDGVVTLLSELNGEINPRLAEDSKLLTTSPSLDMLYRINLTWQDFGRNLSVLARELTQQATSLEQELAELGRLAKTWQRTLDVAKQSNVPLEPLQNAVDSIEQVRAARTR